MGATSRLLTHITRLALLTYHFSSLDEQHLYKSLLVPSMSATDGALSGSFSKVHHGTLQNSANKLPIFAGVL